MDYFVSAQNMPRYQWQLELLIESFKYHNRQNDLLVALAKTDAPPQPIFCRNLFEHPRLFPHQNIGQTRGFAPLNELYSLSWVLQFNRIKQPFTFLSPDVVLYHTNAIRIDSGIPEIVFAPDPFFTLDRAEEAVGPFWEWFGRKKQDYEDQWLPTGPVMIFDNIPQVVFDRTIWVTEKLAFHQLYEGKKEIWEKTLKLGWAVNLNDYVGQIMMRGDYNLTTTMVDSNHAAFINYEHGLPPAFNKSMFTYPPPAYASFGDPFEILAAHAPTPTAHFMSDLAKKNLDTR